MAIICPSVTAYDLHDYRAQMERITPFATRVHIDFMDGVFAPTKSPDLSSIWLPHELIADLHLMYQKPMDYLEQIIKLKPHMVIVHAEAEVHHMHFAAELHKVGIEAGLAILADTPVENIEQVVSSFDHALIFSGNLGHFGGQVDPGLLDKVKRIKDHHPDVEIGWDGGINDQSARLLVDGGVDVLNIGGFIQKAEDPEHSYATLKALAESDT